MKINNRLVGAYGSAVHRKEKLVHEHDFVRATTTATGQANVTSSLPAEQKAAICDPNDTHVNATESRICGKPITPSGSTANANATTLSSENNTSQSTILPSFIP